MVITRRSASHSTRHGSRASQRCDRRIAAELLQAAAAGRPDAADRDAYPDADVGVRHGRPDDEQGKQLLAARGQAAECLTQRRLTFRRQ
ncbi:MAG TPA: hypothetical protein VJ370_03405, partial [Streptosporangiaceae bacterium]|nr:hypothetical protein [Streptosporangiaceae bacterium]